MEVPVFCGQNPDKTARAGHTVCPGLNPHPQPLQPWHWGSSVLSQYQRCRAEGPARLWAEFCQLLVGHGSTQCCVPGVCQAHSLLFSLAAELPADSSGPPWAAPVPGKSTAGPAWGLYCQSISRVRPRVKRLGQGWSPCTARGFACLDLNMKQAWMWLFIFSFLKSIFILFSCHFFSQASRNEWETRRRVDLADFTFFS